MKKTHILILLTLMLCLNGCNSTPITDSETETQVSDNKGSNESESEFESETELIPPQNTEDETLSTIIQPLDSTIDIEHLADGTYSVSLEEDAFYVDENGDYQVVVTIYDYDLYQANDIKNLKLNDTIEILGENITVTSLEKTPLGLIVVNGGFEVGGYDFITNDDSFYFITGASDTKAYYEIGLATLPLASDFAFYDESDNSLEPFHAEDFFVDETEFYYAFSQYNTSVEIKDGTVTSMTRIYTP